MEKVQPISRRSRINPEASNLTARSKSRVISESRRSDLAQLFGRAAMWGAAVAAVAIPAFMFPASCLGLVLTLIPIGAGYISDEFINGHYRT